MYLDMYYLALETFFIREYNKLKPSNNDNKINAINVYDMESPEGKLEIFHQLGSKSVWPFYLALIIITIGIAYFQSFV